MKIITTAKRIIVGSTAGVLIVASPGIALAHGSSGRSGNDGHSQQASASQQQSSQKNKNHGNNDREKNKLTCEQRQQALDQKAADAKTRYTKQLNGLNIVYSGIQTYVASGNVTMENYDSLNATVTADQTAATAAVNAIAAAQLNCDDAAQSLNSTNDKDKHGQDGLNDSVKAARQTLNVYRHDVMKLFQATLDS